MIKTVIIILLLISLYQINLSAEEAEIKPIVKKSVGVGILLGALPFVLPIPGAFGWGNYYAKDYRGFWILNIGSAIGWALVFGLHSILTSTGFESEQVIPFCFLPLGLFVWASPIWDALSVDYYNRRIEKDRVVTDKNKLSFGLASGAKGISMRITYRY